jgi:penicillin V acylase-like amidase (Ntn superfamily)
VLTYPSLKIIGEMKSLLSLRCYSDPQGLVLAVQAGPVNLSFHGFSLPKPRRRRQGTHGEYTEQIWKAGSQPDQSKFRYLNHMRSHLLRLTLATVIASITYTQSFACTTFCIHTADHLVFGKNFDFYTGAGHVVVNKRQLKKMSYSMPPEKTMEWISKYGSITFNQMGKEFPYGGINEKGLVIEIMWLSETEYPEADDRSGLTELQWIQYQLDNFTTVAEVLASDKKVRISTKSVAPVHFLVCDAKGNKATIEYVYGQFVAHTGDALSTCVLTNSTYNNSKKYLNGLVSQGEKGQRAFTTTSFDRFAEASFLVKNFKSGNVVDYAFDVLAKTFQPNFTRWSIVYDIKNMTVHYKTLDNTNERIFRVSDFNFECSGPSLYIDIEEDMKNGKLNFKPYSPVANRKLIATSFSQVDFLQSKTEKEREIIATYPETVKCVK